MTTVVLNTTTRKVEVFSSARDFQARAEIADHKAAADPHPQYLGKADAADIATSGDAADLISGTLPDARMPVWADYTVASKIALKAANVPATTKTVRLLGYASAGDGGGALYTRAASEPSHAGKIRSADRFRPDGTTDADDGGWWEIVVGARDGTDYDSRAFGIFPDTGSEIAVATIQGFLDHQADNKAIAVFPPGKYLGNQGAEGHGQYDIIVLKSYTRIRAYDVDFEDFIWWGRGLEWISFQGGRYYNKQASTAWLWDFNGKNMLFEDCHLDQEEPATTVSPWIYIRAGDTAADQSENVYFNRVRLTNRTNVQLWNVRNLFIDHCELLNRSGEDGFVLKTTTDKGICENVYITNTHHENCSGILSIGTQVGETIKNVHVSNCTGFAGGMAYVRADSTVNANPVLNGGALRNLNVTDCSVYDEEGERFTKYSLIHVNAGSILDGLKITNCHAYVRCQDLPAVDKIFLDLQLKDDGDEGSRIENILFDKCSLIDMHQGVAEDATDDIGNTAVGQPVEGWASTSIPAAAISNGEVRNIEFRDCRLDGASGNGIILADDVPIKYVRPVLRNVGRDGGSVFVLDGTPTNQTKITGAQVINRPADNTKLMALTFGGDYSGFTGALDSGFSGHYSVAAADTLTELPIWIAPQDLIVTRIEMVNAEDIAADETDFLSFIWLSNRGSMSPVTARRFTTADTAVVAGEAIPVWSAWTPAGTAMVEAAYFDRGHSLRLTKTNGGAGAALDNAMFVISYIALGSDGDAD